ncbi:hypothetical protein CSC82_13895 [Rhodobacteraceae bacterium 4F10]|nr:hypothetical protein CSC82_13895 [Rhodobacteraceae bacterium 4F10]
MKEIRAFIERVSSEERRVLSPGPSHQRFDAQRRCPSPATSFGTQRVAEIRDLTSAQAMPRDGSSLPMHLKILDIQKKINPVFFALVLKVASPV